MFWQFWLIPLSLRITYFSRIIRHVVLFTFVNVNKYSEILILYSDKLQNVKMTEQMKLDTILGQLGEDLLAADFRWSILVAAACSYRHDSVLRPFPPMLLRNADALDRNEDSSANSDNGLLENRDYAAMVNVHLIIIIFQSFANSSCNNYMHVLLIC